MNGCTLGKKQCIAAVCQVALSPIAYILFCCETAHTVLLYSFLFLHRSTLVSYSSPVKGTSVNKVCCHTFISLKFLHLYFCNAVLLTYLPSVAARTGLDFAVFEPVDGGMLGKNCSNIVSNH